MNEPRTLDLFDKWQPHHLVPQDANILKHANLDSSLAASMIDDIDRNPRAVFNSHRKK
eukprot:CAMPEP_0173130942 /NCGR_PEP_ID=MMETSP1102-20130122/60340_1 /TAXON_ID=49646 /ORGANISM="Geminigera sp., Strain Caron Lab Isolate" /LENGTH=57 /DNA_ID=CAMNT_0014042153 /DNA_START=564 /DNA_END=734 /DNA_ORIENTATION=+